MIMKRITGASRFRAIRLTVVICFSLAMAACNLGSSLAKITVSPAPAAQAFPTFAPATVTSAPSLIATTQLVPTRNPALAHRPLVWFAPLPPMPTGPGRPFIGSDDFMDLFKPDAPWSQAGSHIQVFKLYGEWVAYDASDGQLRQVVADLNRRGIAIAVEAGPLNPTSECGQGVESFAGTQEGQHIAQRIKDAGGVLSLVALDEPFYYAHLYDGPNACHWPADLIARNVKAYIDSIKIIFPGVQVGDTEPLTQPKMVSDLEGWLDEYHATVGEYFAFIHLDCNFTQPDWASPAKELETFARTRSVDFGLIYSGDGSDLSDGDWLAHAGQRVMHYEVELGGKPDQVLFQSWHDHPDRVLPENDPSSFTGFIDRYFFDWTLLGKPPQGPGSNLARAAKVSASKSLPANPPALVIDGDSNTFWSAGDYPPQWIQLDLGAPHAIKMIMVGISQYPVGITVHRVLGKGPGSGDAFILLHEFKGETRDAQVLSFTPDQPWQNIQYLRIETMASPSWVSWREIEIISADQP